MDPNTGIRIAKELLTAGREVDLYKLSRYCYSVSDSLVTDSFYSSLEEYIIGNNLCAELVSQSQDDDDVPISLLEEFNLMSLVFSNRVESEYFNFLDSEKSMSIKALITYREFYDYCMGTVNEDKIFSPKKDGINLKDLYVNGKMELGVTRGRKGNCFDITSNLSKIVPNTIDTEMEHVVVYGECGVDSSKVSIMPRKSGGDFTLSRTAALALMRTGMDDESYFKYLKFHAFNADGVADTISKTVDKLNEWGFDTLPYILVKAEEIPKDFEEFCVFTKSIMDRMWQFTKDYDIDTDGVVVDINSKNFIPEQTNQYLSRNCALKFEYWSHYYYIGIVKTIHVEQKAVQASVVIEIEPLKTQDNCKARRITSYNPSYLFDLKLYPGQKVYFERNSGAINVLLTGDKLKEALGKTENVLTTSNTFTPEEGSINGR